MSCARGSLRDHGYYMEMALGLAAEADRKGQLPVGAVIVKDGEVIARAHSHVLIYNDPTAHAEILAIRQACEKLGKVHLDGCTMYDSFEPCPMCCGAIINSGISTLVVGGRFMGDARSYKDYSYEALIDMAGASDQIVIVDGVLRERANALLTVEKRRAWGKKISGDG